MGAYWIYFSSMKWFDRSWAKDLFITADNGNYIPGYSQVLTYAANYSGTIAIAVTIIESIIGACILLAILTRVAATIGAFLDLNLMLTFAFCRCHSTQADFPLVFWFYFLPLILNVLLALDESGYTYGLQGVVQSVRKAVTD
jgi:uncharacterized membrane protein YphA (DoxX/SURF4 family)